MSENWARGPWSICGSTSIRDAANRPIATVRSLDPKMDGSHNENRDTANLIAAAPELYAALDILEWLDGADGGPPFCPICGEDIDHWHNKGCKLHNALKKARGES